MAESLFCLDISGDTVTGVLIERNGKVTVIVGCGHVEIVDRQLEEAIAEVCEQAGFMKGKCTLSLNMEFFSFRNLSLPFADRKKIAQILPLEMENISIAEPGSCLTDFVLAKTGVDDSSIVTATLEKTVLASFLKMLSRRGIDPLDIEIRSVRAALRLAEASRHDCVLLDISGFAAGLIIVSGGRIALLRSLRFPVVSAGERKDYVAFGRLLRKSLLASRIVDLEKNEFAFFLTGNDVDHEPVSEQIALHFGVEVSSFQLTQQPLLKVALKKGGWYHPLRMDPVLALSFKTQVKNGNFSFRKEEFKRKRSISELRTLSLKVVLPLICVAVALFIYFGYDYYALKGEQKSLKKQIARVFTETMPKVKKVVKPVQQLQAEIKEIRKTFKQSKGEGGNTVISLLTEISARIPSTYPITVKKMVIDGENVRIKGVTTTFNTVDNIQKELEKSTYFKTVTISSATQSTEGDQIRFEMKLELF